MPGPDNLTPDTPVVISDPSERLRHEHLWGDRLMIHVGNTVAWLLPILMVAIVAQIFMRKQGFNQAWLDDAQWWIYGFSMLTAFGYAITNESHVRVDILHQNFSTKKKARIEVFALGWLLLPFLAIMTDLMLQYAWTSFVAREGSDSPNGLHKLYLLKATMPALFMLSIIAAWSAMKRNFAKVSTPHLWKLLLAAMPFCLFVAERIMHDVFYWFIYLTQPDIIARKISKEPLLQYSLHAGLILLLLITIIAYLRRSPVVSLAEEQR